jgi:hypothetical protein
MTAHRATCDAPIVLVRVKGEGPAASDSRHEGVTSTGVANLSPNGDRADKIRSARDDKAGSSPMDDMDDKIHNADKGGNSPNNLDASDNPKARRPNAPARPEPLE